MKIGLFLILLTLTACEVSYEDGSNSHFMSDRKRNYNNKEDLNNRNTFHQSWRL